MKRIVIIVLFFFLFGCVSNSQMSQEFYGGIEQGSKEFGEIIGDLSVYIGMYEGSSRVLKNAEWQDAVSGESEKLVGKANFLYSITKTYCPRDEDILCDDIKTLYLKSRDLYGDLSVAIELESDAQMQEAIQEFDDILAHMESMSSGQ